jgi:hypothetical protein
MPPESVGFESPVVDSPWGSAWSHGISHSQESMNQGCFQEGRFRGRGVVLAAMLGLASCGRAGQGARDVSHGDRPGPPCVVTAPVETTSGPASTCAMPSDLGQPWWPRTLSGVSARELDGAPEGSVSVALLPDTQYYAKCRSRHLENQSRWLVRERERRHIVAALSLGDLTDDNSDEQWAFVRQSFSPLGAGFPLLLTTGNHDTGEQGSANRRETLLSKYLYEDYAKKSGALRSVAPPGGIENAFYSFDLGRVKLGILMLEWGPRRTIVDWANQILDQYADHRVIVVTHAYLYDDGTRYDYAARGTQQVWNPLTYPTAAGAMADDPSHDGEMLFQALVRRHAGIFLVASGHVLGQGAAHLTSRGDAGNTIHQILANYQMLDEGGLGYLRLLELQPDGRVLHMKTYSPSLGLFSYAAEQDFRLEVEPPLGGPEGFWGIKPSADTPERSGG